MGDKRRYQIKNEYTRGTVLLLKNGKVIRENKFYSRSDRRMHMKEYMSICKIGTQDSYFIDIKLDDHV